ncbi:PepSY domain-containing protein [Polymorphobacter sp. PAMC 29334]|uniref:PepSY-associated TM helix domain-containing protein n=1 Tax=Polymorphobacter sp. PAMC 29334 TaxID=2862331 RepID=UPI001C683163|nr:PepSY-associated TM helix domain-containing protein [Polymorphobacter sp. PAMC 29334]QYE36432.1 PepSY domain-containing protein [Polymorphobacter sp. PAMC 29334]
MTAPVVAGGWLRQDAQRYVPTGRQFWVVAHRWAGLTIALFLIVAGTTGSLLTFREELTRATSRASARVALHRPGAPMLDGTIIAERVEAATGAKVTFVPLDREADRPLQLFVGARPGAPALDYDTVWANPYDGSIQFRARDGVLADGPENIMPFLYKVHHSLALGEWGTFALGCAALIWTLDCFVGFYLTLPARRPRSPTLGLGKGWGKKWSAAWRIKGASRGYRFHFDLHRAGGLWLWPLLLVFAWSSVGFNLPAVHRPVMAALGASPDVDPAPLAAPIADPPIDLRAAAARGRALIAVESAGHGFTVRRDGFLYYIPESATYLYSAWTSLDVSTKDASTQVWFSGIDGRLIRFVPPLGATTADAATIWFGMIHRAAIIGLPYRIFEAVLGLALVALSVTGILIWMKKRSARVLHFGWQTRQRRPINAARSTVE